MMNSLNRSKIKMMKTVSQIWEWVMRPKVWRFVGNVSAVIGLVCYGLSSSFNYLFGHWNVLKIVLYILFSIIIIICYNILFARRPSTSHLIKAHAAFVVLAGTIFYSFFFDKSVNGKPDAYSLLSCVAFAIMSLSLSRKIQSGYQIDLTYFFLGSLIMQLMKIKLLLFIPGAGFGYLIIIFRSHVSSTNDANQAESHSQQLVSTFVHPHSAQSIPITDFGSMKEQLDDCLKALQQENSTLIEMLMEKLKDYLSDDSGFIMKSDPDFMIMALPTETIDNLHKTAKLMVSAGRKYELSAAYCSSRRGYLDESLSRLGFKNLSYTEVQRLSRKLVEDEIKGWIKASNVALKILLPAERKLWDRVFFGFSSPADSLFMDVCRTFTLDQLLSFPESINVGVSKSPERLFRYIYMFETIRDLIPEVESLFRDQNSGSLQIKAMGLFKEYRRAIRISFLEFAKLIWQDSMEEVNLDGELHPIAIYVMNYLCAASGSRKTLEQVFDGKYDRNQWEHNYYPKIDDTVPPSSLDLSALIGYLMKLLMTKLRIFHMKLNRPGTDWLTRNSDYIVQKPKESELGAILGDDWFKTSALGGGSMPNIKLESKKIN